MKPRCLIVVLMLFSLSGSILATGQVGERDLLSYAIEVIKKEEGFHPKVYRDTACCIAIGYGRQLVKEFGFELDKYAPTTRDVEEKHIAKRVTTIHRFLGSRYGAVYLDLSVSRKVVLISMTYQMGYKGVTRFRVMWSALGIKDYGLAGDAMRNSRWYSQTRGRAMRHISTMRLG